MKSKGFTLIELAVVLAIIAVLAAVLTPVVVNYLDQARVTRALADATTISQAVQLYKRDVGFYPVYSSLANARMGTTTYGTLIGGTAVPAFGSGLGWDGILTGTTVGDILTQLNTNIGLTPNVENPGKTSFRGPYIGALDTDPWGNAYVVANLTPTASGHAFVISAGPNGKLETNAYQNGPSAVPAGDDILAQIF
jgi:general secretion pathway protein G